MKKTILLSILGAMLIPAQAAAEVSPQKQAALEMLGFSAVDEESSEPLPASKKGHDACRGKRIGSAIRRWDGKVEVRGNIGLAACADKGRIVWKRGSVRYASPSDQWDHVWGPSTYFYRPCPRCQGFKYEQEWKFKPWGQYWQLHLRLVAHVQAGTDHQIWFSKRRVWY